MPSILEGFIGITELSKKEEELLDLKTRAQEKEKEIAEEKRKEQEKEEALNPSGDGIINSVITSKPFVYGAGALGLYALYRNRKKAWLKQKEDMTDVKAPYKKPESFDRPEKPFEFTKG